MKIAFIGTHGVGKTTLCYELAAALKRMDVSVDLVKEIARRCPLPINRDTTSQAQEWILHTQVAEEIELSCRYDAIVCDRAVLDNYAYMVHATGRRLDLEPFIGHWIGTYDLFVKVPVVGAPRFDGTRDVSVNWQLAIDAEIDRLIGQFGIDHLALPVADRTVWIPRVLERLALPPSAPQLDLF